MNFKRSILFLLVAVSGFDKTKLGEQIITITYKDKTVSYKIEVIKEIEEVKTVERISIKQLPDKLEYVVGKDNLDLSGGILLVRYSDGTVTEVEMTNARVVILGFSNVNVGIRTLTVSFEGKTTTFDIEIIEEISEAELIEKIEIYKLPTKLKYIANLEQLDLSGGSIKVIYEDCSFKLKSKHIDSGISQEMINWIEANVIGNIFDNPELLGEQQ